VVEQTWRLDTEGPTGNSSARIGERPRIEPTAVQQAREGEAWYIARGRFEHLMVARTTISDGYRARAHAMVALARSWRPAEVLPGARTWVEAQAAGQEALRGLQGHLAIEPPPDADSDDSGPPTPPEPPGPVPAGHRLRLAVAAAARDGDQDTTATLVRQARPTAWRWSSCWRWLRPIGPSPACTVAPSGPGGAGPRAGGGGCIGLEARRRWPNRSTGHDRGMERAGAERPPRFAAVRGPRPLRGPARPGRLPAGRAATSSPPRSRVAARS
jgi:hypothetical protein